MSQKDKNNFDPIAALLGDEQNKIVTKEPTREAPPTRGPQNESVSSTTAGTELSKWRQYQKKLPPTMRETDKLRQVKIMAFMGLLLIGFVIGCLWFARPTESESEKRKLASFPEFSFSALWSGQWTKDISTWYADSYPTREGMIGLSHIVRSTSGIHASSIKVSEKGDDVPTDVPPNLDDYFGEQETTNDPPESGQTINNLFVSGDTAYELYAFNKTQSLRYAQLINHAKAQVGEGVNVYDIIVPLSYSVNLKESTWKGLGATDADAAIKYMYSAMSPEVKTISILDTLKAHSDEYLYYRTDHHWNAFGAYYAYTDYCKAAGINPTPLSDYAKKTEIQGFLGTLYADAGKPSSLGNHPDVVTTFKPIATNDIIHYDKDGTKYTTYGIVNGVSKSSNKYLAYLGGDFAFSEIHNPDKHDGSSVLVVKESFGNAFVPFLVDSYEYVYVVDYRYYTQMTLSQLVSSKSIQNVIFVNNVVATSASARINEMSKFVDGQ